MPELNLLNVLTILAWSVAGLWLAALVWTWFSLKSGKIIKKSDAGSSKNPPLVSILVPARNEAHRVLEKSIGSMLAQDYEKFELIALNDRSTDDTKKILENLRSAAKKIDFRIIDGRETERGWLGKPFALQQAFNESRGEWILTTDADIVFAPETLRAVIEYAEKTRLDALTLIPRQTFGSFWERLFMPIFGWFCVLAMPLHRVNDPRRKDALGIGNFFLFRRAALEAIDAFECVRAEVAEDLRLAKILKDKNFRLRAAYTDLIETRMYAGFREIWEGFTKNLFSGMKFSIPKTVFGVFSIIVFGVLPVFAAVGFLLAGNLRLFLPLFADYLLETAVFALVNSKWRSNVLYAFLAPVGLMMFAAILSNSAVRVLSGKGVTWKGRPIYEKGGVRPPLRQDSR